MRLCQEKKTGDSNRLKLVKSAGQNIKVALLDHLPNMRLNVFYIAERLSVNSIELPENMDAD